MNRATYPTACPNCGNDLTERVLIRRSVPRTEISQHGFLLANGRICTSLQRPPRVTASPGNVYCTGCDQIVWDVETKKLLGEAVR